MSGVVLKFPIGEHAEIRGERIAGRLAWRVWLVSSCVDLDDLPWSAYPTRREAVAASRRMWSLPIICDDGEGADLITAGGAL